MDSSSVNDQDQKQQIRPQRVFTRCKPLVLCVKAFMRINSLRIWIVTTVLQVSLSIFQFG